MYRIAPSCEHYATEVDDMDNNEQRAQVTAVRKNGDGDITELQLSNGQVVGYKEAQQMAKANQIDNVNVFKGRDGDEHLRSNPDGREDNNLDNLPTF